MNWWEVPPSQTGQERKKVQGRRGALLTIYLCIRHIPTSLWSHTRTSQGHWVRYRFTSSHTLSPGPVQGENNDADGVTFPSPDLPHFLLILFMVRVCYIYFVLYLVLFVFSFWWEYIDILFDVHRVGPRSGGIQVQRSRVVSIIFLKSCLFVEQTYWPRDTEPLLHTSSHSRGDPLNFYQSDSRLTLHERHSTTRVKSRSGTTFTRLFRRTGKKTYYAYPWLIVEVNTRRWDQGGIVRNPKKETRKNINNVEDIH